MPMKIHKTPAGDAAGRARLFAKGVEGRPVLNRRAVFDEAKEDDETLQEAADERGAPDFQPGGPPKESASAAQTEGKDHMQHPVFPETVPWPPAEKPALPFKVK